MAVAGACVPAASVGGSSSRGVAAGDLSFFFLSCHAAARERGCQGPALRARRRRGGARHLGHRRADRAPRGQCCHATHEARAAVGVFETAGVVQHHETGPTQDGARLLGSCSLGALGGMRLAAKGCLGTVVVDRNGPCKSL